MRLTEIVPGQSDRAMIVGQTGSGKTVLAQFLLSYRKYVIVIDPKRRINWPGYPVVQSVSALVRHKGDKVVYRPSHVALKGWYNGDDEEIARAFEYVYMRGNTTLYVDEAYLVTRGEELPQFYHACLTQGRELGVETWSATQRPMHVPQVIMSEAEHLYEFYLKMPQDRKKVFAMGGVSEERIRGLPKHHFYYVPQDDEPIGPLKLDLTRLQKK